MGSIGDDKVKQSRRRSICLRVTIGCVGDELVKTQVAVLPELENWHISR